MAEIKKISKVKILKKIEEEKTKTFAKKDMELICDKKGGLTRYFSKIKDILKEFMDMDEEFFSLVSIWIIGTYFHKQFPSYPYLYFNAMKGSGKTRVMKIIASLSKEGKVVGSMTEAVLFRTAKTRTFCIDELETNEKGKQNLRLLLNSAYKKGLFVERMIKKKVDGQEQHEVEEFEVYCPIVVSNIWGLENTLQDRCISVILEKSSKNVIIKLIENFEKDIKFQTTKGGLLGLTEKLQNEHQDFFKSGIFDNVFSEWNSYIKNRYKGIQDNNSVSVVSKVNIVNEVSVVSNNKNNIVSKKIEKREKKENLKGKTYDTYDIYAFTILFEKINKTNLSGRDLELFFPLFILADIIGEDVLTELLKTSQKIVKARKESDREENKDVRLFEFIAQSDYKGFINLSDIAKEFSEFSDEDPKYNTSNSVSRALNRLKLILEKRSTGRNRQAKINVLKAQEKLLMFKDPEEIKGFKQFSDTEIKEAGWTREKLQKTLEEPEKPKKEKQK